MGEARDGVGSGSGVVIDGLWLEGCAWGDGALTEAAPGELAHKMPKLWLEPRAHAGDQAGFAVVPIYKTSERAGVLSTTGRSTNFVVALNLPVRRVGDGDVFVRRGGALVLEKNV